ncbi:hypothetical protein Vse01_52930 [Micromonospora sediminimaris]|uniref:Uncharacterized protein n=1 Tax=Micromonospora sediminimaris TaxID=547162 RepID=A0A9W5UWX6_9ACTN|nr:hypothetical protein Vse01_52930 [Micromonospora sediminimaris]
MPAKVSVPPSGSDDPAEKEFTVNGATPEVRFAEATAVGARFPPPPGWWVVRMVGIAVLSLPDECSARAGRAPSRRMP